MQVLPYIIPGRTGCMMQVEDLAILAEQYPNVGQVKEATGDLENMAKTRRICGDDFTIFSGDDDKTVATMWHAFVRPRATEPDHGCGPSAFGPALCRAPPP